MSEGRPRPRRIINHVYAFTFHGRLLQDLRQQIIEILSGSHDNAPDIKVHDAIHGVAKLELLNFRGTYYIIMMHLFVMGMIHWKL